MIGGDETFAVKLEKFWDNSRYTFVHGFDGFDSRLNYAGVADHVGIGEVEDDQIVFRHAREHFVGDLKRAHLWFQVVGSNFWRGNQFAIFARKRFLDSAIKKVSHVRVFLCLRDAQLRFAGSADHLSQDLAKLLLRKNERRTKADVVLREADKMDLRPDLAVEAIEIFQQKRLRQLSRPISTKVEKQNGVAIAHALLVRLEENQRRHELVGLAK